MSIFFNTTYYLQNNPDVLQAVAQGVMPSAEFHFNEFGWKENRAPNETFDVEFYLINNPDVLAAGMNPLTHFIAFGAAEGRAPSATFVTLADFDTDAYAAANPDLEAAGLTTEAQLYAHFAVFGFEENRPGVQTNDGEAIGANGVVGAPAAGDPVVGDTFTLTDGLDQLTGTDNDDVFQGLTVNLSDFDAINGGAGTDTLNLIGEIADASANVTISNIEIVNLSGNTGAVDASNFGATAQQIWQIGSAGDVDNVGNTTTVGFRNVTLSTDVEYTGSVGNVALDNVGDGSTLWSYGEITTLNVSGSLEQDSDPTVVEYLELHDHTDDGSGDRTIETLNLSLSTGTEVNLVGEFEALTTFNAAGSNAGIEIDLRSNDLLETATFGTGSDDVMVALGEANTTVDLGAGGDFIEVDGTGGAENVSLSLALGEGSDTVTFGTLSNIVDATEANFMDGMISIADFTTAAGGDLVDFGGLVFETLTNPELTAIAGAADLFAALDVAAGFITAAPNAAVSFDFGGNAYFLTSVDTDFNDGDGLVEMVGVSVAELNASNFIA